MDEGWTISGEAMELLQAGGLKIEVEGVVLSARWFTAEGQRVAKVTLLGSKDSPLGSGVQCNPYPIFEVDADYQVFESLRLDEPVRLKFLADLKPINNGGYVLHLLKVLE
ncbi:hypothetical protein D3C78_1604690 [compost metagenome]